MSRRTPNTGGDASGGIVARYCPVKRISVKEIRQMYDVFHQYYAETDMDTFIRDLSRKQGVILIRTRKDQRVVGFSTIVSLDMEIGRLRSRGVFSGDTIIEREFWGTRKLQVAFLIYLLREKLRRPFRPLYWLLISKGYKTYLLMANNFHNYYPHPEQSNPELLPVVRHYCDAMFPGHYDPDRGVLDFGEGAQHLKGEVAAITDDLKQRVPKIRFFEECNPTWHEGTELPCVGQVNLSAVTAFIAKVFRGYVSSLRTSARSGVMSAEQGK